LQDSLQAEGKVAPWLEKHELGKLPRLWQKLQIEAGWENALESVLRERTGALEVSNLDWAKAFFSDAPPAKLSLFSLSGTAASTEGAASGLKPLLSLLQLNDPGLRALMQDWLHNVYVADDSTAAMADRSRLPAGGCFVTKQGHLISKLSVRFYATDSEQDGMLARRRGASALGAGRCSAHAGHAEAGRTHPPGRIAHRFAACAANGSVAPE
jgi:chromosome segregation protein